ncbi:SCO7613 C-terminal domain-containing membrane protein [Streptomyces sp. NPDC091292]|uniref:SCO7613 C-terminal domain-containing membrane protein n=1 Tax=Streptomyces sp. NPDC091292 TaxID=3365991 RepID=UPI00381524AA
MTNFPPPAEELRALDLELRQLDARRTQLLARRAWLLGALQAASRQPAPAWGPPAPRAWGAPAPTAANGSRPEAGAPGVQNLLLVLGGGLLTIAAIAFTVVSWGHLGITGRSAVLGAVTLAALGVPVLLLKSGLRATAETVAGLGLALTALDAYALHELALPGTSGTGFTAAAMAVLAVVWAAYGLWLRELRLPLPSAVAAVQLPLFLWGTAAGAGAHTLTAALLATCAFDAALALRTDDRATRIAAAVGALVTGAWGVLAAGWLSWVVSDLPDAAGASALLALAAVIAFAVAYRVEHTGIAFGTALSGGLLSVAALGGVPAEMLTGAPSWTVPLYLLCGLAVGAVALRPWAPAELPFPDGAFRRGLAAASATVPAVAVLWTLPSLAVAALGPVNLADAVWSGVPSDILDGSAAGVPLPDGAAVCVTLAAVTGVLYALARRAGRQHARYQPLSAGTLAIAWATLFLLPSALSLPYAAVVAAQIALTAGLLTVAATTRTTDASTNTGTGTDTGAAAGTGTGATAAEPDASPLGTTPRSLPVLPLTAHLLALGTSLSIACLALATEAATLATLAALTVLFALSCLRTARSEDPLPAQISAGGAFVYATGLAGAVGGSAGWAHASTALLVLVVPVAAALLAARLGRHPLTAVVECAGAAAGLLAIGLAAEDPPMLALVLALCGVVCAGTAVRDDQRSAGYAAGALFVLATWVRLGAWEVRTPEAYTIPVTVLALAVGVLRRRRDPEASSWVAYGPGLAATLLPSLVAAWGDGDWPRPLLLGAAAFVITLVGARQRLQAPLVLGGGVLALVALHELAPYIVQMVGALPRWLPPALAGLVLLALGATYEQRLRDARRMRDALGKLR